MLTDAEIAKLMAVPKRVTKSSRGWREKDGHLEFDVELVGDDGTKFGLYARQNRSLSGDFSCGLRHYDSAGESVSLVRYNGDSHQHRNALEGDRIDFKCHIHAATERYQNCGRRADGFARETSVYGDLSAAVSELWRDASIQDPLKLPGHQLSLATT